MFRYWHRWLKLGELIRIHVSNVHRGLLGPDITHVGGWPSWRSGVPDETPRRLGGPPRSVAHASASPNIKNGACHKRFKKYEFDNTDNVYTGSF